MDRPLTQLAPQAFEVLHAILTRAGVAPPDAALRGVDGSPVATIRPDRPPLDSLPAPRNDT